MKRKNLKLFCLPLFSCLIVSLSEAQVAAQAKAESQNSMTAQSKLILQAGKRLGVPVRTERMVHLAQGSVAWFAASAANLESTPATELPHGVNLGVAYFDLLDQKFPKDFYKIRAFANVNQTGRFEGRAQLINDKGAIVGELPAMVEVKSMTLPERAASGSTNLTVCTGAACNIGGGTPPAVGFWICFECSNGFTVCVCISIHDLLNMME